MNLRVEGQKGHNLNSIYSQPLSYTAKIIGVRKETARRALESLHARGIVIIDQLTWDEMNDANGKRRSTGMVRDISLSEAFIATMKHFGEGLLEMKSWCFDKVKGFVKKQEGFRAKAKKAKDQFIEAMRKKMNKKEAREKEPLKEFSSEDRNRYRQCLRHAGDESETRRLLNYLCKALVKKGVARDVRHALQILR